MSFKSLSRSAAFSAIATLALVGTAAAEMIVQDAYARSSNKMSGGAFMEVLNQGDTDDRLVEARSDVAKRVELHTSKEDANGVMKMMPVEEGFAIPAGGTHMFQRGGDHIMFMGLNRELKDGDKIDVTLVFEKAGEVPVQIEVDMDRQPTEGHAGHDNHGDHSEHSN
ncbi:MAG: copper chaperone PCu(A)C [Tritonibacter mobilis]|nr:conserved hypothetical protein [Ruegeria sp. TrichCH4B]MCK5502877.1 copper chaperone PCu(A)C [Tritonibacter mobilis]